MAQTMETPSSSEDLTQRLPVDLLSDVLCRLHTTSPPSVAVSRCVCKAWRHVVDTHKLLADLPPHQLTGIFVHLAGDTRELLTKHFSPATSPTNVAAAFDYVDAECSTIKHHCNGLLLLDNEWPRRRGPIQEKAWVLNPATRRWERLPPLPPMCTPGMEDVYDFYIEVMCCHDRYLVFDPAVSPHYEVFLVKRVPCLPWLSQANYMEDHVTEREWPPPTFVLLVFSSTTERWEERPFIRQGEAAATIGYMLDDGFQCAQCYAAYWRGALYVHQNGFILRMALSNDKYRVIELPEGFCGSYLMDQHLGKSENGVYCARLDDHGDLRLRIWYLDETCDRINWRSKCDINLGPILADFYGECGDASSEWCSLLGFHPNEETVFLHTPLKRVVAFHFDSSKMEDLGCLPVEPRDYIYASFPYTLVFMQGVVQIKYHLGLMECLGSSCSSRVDRLVRRRNHAWCIAYGFVLSGDL